MKQIYICSGNKMSWSCSSHIQEGEVKVLRGGLCIVGNLVISWDLLNFFFRISPFYHQKALSTFSVYGPFYIVMNEGGTCATLFYTYC